MSSVMPIEDEEAGPSQNSESVTDPANAVTSFVGTHNAAAANEHSTITTESLRDSSTNVAIHQPRDQFTITNENRRHSSKSSLPATFSSTKASKKHWPLYQFGSEIVRSIVTPPRGNSSTLVEDTRQKSGALDNNNPENDNNANANSAHKLCRHCSSESKHCEIGVKQTASKDSANDLYCRICHDSPSKLLLVSPCLCKGTMGLVHLGCLERWLGESGKNICEICGFEYVTRRKPKYTGCRSIFQWLRHPLTPADTRNLVFDLACFCILTPLAAVSAWLCVLGAQHYTFGQGNRRFSDGQRAEGQESGMFRSRNRYPYSGANSTWTSVGLLTLTGTLLSAYIVWLVVAFRFHLQVFRDWQTRNFIVTIVPMTERDQAVAHETRDTETALIRSYFGDLLQDHDHEVTERRQLHPAEVHDTQRRNYLQHLELVQSINKKDNNNENEDDLDGSEKNSNNEESESDRETGSIDISDTSTLDGHETGSLPSHVGDETPGTEGNETPMSETPYRTNSSPN